MELKDIKRMKYFKGEFLTADDFQCEQDYHRDLRLQHNMTLHTPGIVSGLNVTAGNGTVTIGKGTATDRFGRELVLVQDLPVPVTTAISIAIKYKETEDSATSEGGFIGVKRATIGVELCQDSDPDAIALAKVTNASTSPVTLDQSVRVYASPFAPGNMIVGQDLTVNGNLKVMGDPTFVKNQKTQGNVILGDEDTDTVTIEGSIFTGHSSGKLKIGSPVDISGALAVVGPISATGSLTLPANGLNAGAGQLALANGNVGVGTASPENAEGWSKVLDMLGGTTTKLSVRTTNIDARILAHESGWWGAPAGMAIGTKTNHPLSLGTNAASRMTITAGGNVGIGTTSPAGKLDVNGDIYRSGLLAISGEAGGWLRINQNNHFPNGTHFAYRANFNGGITTGNWWSVDPGVGNLLVQGNVGIGTTAPGYKLDVTGGGIGGNYGLTPKYANWAAYGTGDGGAAIYNSNENAYRALMLVGNNSAGGARVVKVWDDLGVQGNLDIAGNLMKNGIKSLMLVGVRQQFNNLASSSTWIEKMMYGVKTNMYTQVGAQAWSPEYGWGNSAITFYFNYS